MKTLSSGAPFCLTVTLLDGIVFAPTAVGHSVNYRSVVVMGKAELVEGEAAKLRAMRDFVNMLSALLGHRAAAERNRVEGHHGPCRAARGASAKVRTGFAVDESETTLHRMDRCSPMKWTAQAPVPDPRGNPAIPVPANILHYSRPQ